MELWKILKLLFGSLA